MRRERGVRGVVAQPRAPRDARLEPPHELVTRPSSPRSCAGISVVGVTPLRWVRGPDSSARSLDAGESEKTGAGRVVICFF